MPASIDGAKRLRECDKYLDLHNDAEEKEKVKRAAECCRTILNYVNQAVKESENKQRLEDYQRRLDLSSLKQSENPIIAEFKNLDLTKKKMVHEGPLSWKVNKDKTIELYTLLLEDILVLLQKQDERLILKCHSKNLAGTADTRQNFSPIIKLSTVLVRSVATDNKSFFVLSMSDNGAQIYELMAQTVSEQRMWQHQITQSADSIKSKQCNVITQPELKPTLPPGPNPFEGIKSDDEEEEGEEAAFLDSDLADRLPFMKQRSRQGVAIDDNESNPFVLPPSRAEEALKACGALYPCVCVLVAALRQVLVTQMMSQKDGEGTGRAFGGRLQRTTSLRTPVDPGARGMVTLSSPENGMEQSKAGKEERLQGLDASDVCNYLVLEGSGESSTDDEVSGKEHHAAGDSGIDMKKLLSSVAQPGGAPTFSRQVLTYLRVLQAHLHYLKDVESKYIELHQRQAGHAAETEDNRGGPLGVRVVIGGYSEGVCWALVEGVCWAIVRGVIGGYSERISVSRTKPPSRCVWLREKAGKEHWLLSLINGPLLHGHSLDGGWGHHRAHPLRWHKAIREN
ncbi:hypothetical protein JZ751_002000 [Albula glossodonta]|uniref:PH domain-containing protein n=1 Tax=Albula glossodonta TaxID=121402 RepID=A0A8T2P6S6_9TELE|nr:hypothetical protein JZ751_002000 [Albula glossodonta]